MPILAALLFSTQAQALTTYQPSDSILVEKLLRQASQQPKETNLTIWFSRQLLGIPYVAHTLEVNAKEQLVVNLRELDCTTYVENVIALTLCAKHGQTDFGNYRRYLRNLRYRQGRINDYPSRLHYFTDWIEDNHQMGFIDELQTPNPPFTAVQTLDINYMTTHSDSYKMLKGQQAFIHTIRKQEQAMTGKKYRYIPKASIANNTLFRSTIHDGDIIAITTSKRGLDTSHIGIAVWHTDGLHLLNASQIHKKVVEEPMTLHEYMQKHPSQTGIRVVRMR